MIKSTYGGKLFTLNDDVLKKINEMANVFEDSNNKQQKKELVFEGVEEFKDKFYSIHGIHKKYPVKYVIKVHERMVKDLGLREIHRSEKRNITKYFNNFFHMRDKIISYLESNAKEISVIFVDYEFKKI